MTDDTSPLDAWLDAEDDDDESRVEATADAIVADAPPADPPSPDANEAQVAAEPVRADRGDGRDAHGRFVGKEGEEQAPTPPGDAVVGAPADASSPPPLPNATAPSTPQAEEEAGAPFVVKFKGQEFEVPGARVTEQGVFIPRESADLVNAYLGKGAARHSRAA